MHIYFCLGHQIINALSTLKDKQVIIFNLLFNPTYVGYKTLLL